MEDSLKIQVIIDEPIIHRASFVPKEFICTDCAIALVLKELFPGLHPIHVFDEGFGFCNKDGYEVWTRLPYDAQDWIKDFDRRTPAERKQMKNIRFTIELDKLAIDSVGEFSIKQICRGSRNLKLV